jgi:hypothetical protein
LLLGCVNHPQEPSNGSIRTLRRPFPQGRRPDQGRQAHPRRLQDEAQGRLRLPGTAAHFAAESSTGTNVEVCTTDDFTKGVDALVYYIDEATET